MFDLFLVEPFYVKFLDVSAIGEHDGTKVSCRIGANNRSPEAKFVDIGDQSRMVDVGVSQDDVVDLFGIETQVAVGGIRFHAFPLKHSAVKQDFFTVIEGNQMFAAGYFAGGTDKFYLHNCIFCL